MKVRLKRDWFAPNHSKYPRSDARGFTEVPVEYRDRLPKDAVVLDEDPAPVVEEVQPVPTRASLDVERLMADDVEKVVAARGGAAEVEAAIQRVKKKG